MRLRQSARVVLLDEHDRVLLVKLHDTTIVNPSHPIPDTFWVTIGGALEPGETFEDAVRREVFEEAGLREFALGPWLWERAGLVNWGGEMIRAYERYYLGRARTTGVVFDHLLPQERGVFRAFRWWSVEELREASATETFLPPGLPHLLADVLNGLPVLPVLL